MTTKYLMSKKYALNLCLTRCSIGLYIIADIDLYSFNMSIVVLVARWIMRLTYQKQGPMVFAKSRCRCSISWRIATALLASVTVPFRGSRFWGLLPFILAKWHRSGSTLVQVTACCLTVLNHYLNQCWLIINCVLCISQRPHSAHICLPSFHLIAVDMPSSEWPWLPRGTLMNSRKHRPKPPTW